MFAKIFRKVVFAVLVVSLFAVPVFADTPVDVRQNSEALSLWDKEFDVWTGIAGLEGLMKEMSWSWFDNAFSRIGWGRVSDLETLQRKALQFNSIISKIGTFPEQTVSILMTMGLPPTATAVYDSGLELWILVDERTGYPLVNSAGAYLYYEPTKIDPETNEEVKDPALGGQWIRRDQVSWLMTNVVNEATLYKLGWALRAEGQDNTVKSHAEKIQYIASEWETMGEHYVYCDESGFPYVYRPALDQWAQDSNNNYYTDDNDGDGIYDSGETEDNTLIDLDTNTVWFPDGTVNYIDNLIYDDSTKTYFVDAHTEYNVENNTYITNNYKYEYHINYTSVTYIGQTAEYDKLYEFYYELPDGRSSADLTADELQALNTKTDVVPYIRSADSTALRSLYHFDGNTFDDSYWSYTTDFKWVDGASLTYMDAGPFNGALYLDEQAHEFAISLPSGLGSGDFTIQWRVYQSQTLDSSGIEDSYLKIGSNVLYWDGKEYTLGSLTYPTPIGTWHEVALIRHDGKLRLYINGLPVAMQSSSTAYGKEITFRFGAVQQTYKYFDELRVLDYALVEDGASYAPTAVPHDTNLTLVLPDSTVPVADEYWSFNASGNVLPVYDLSQLPGFDTFAIDTGAGDDASPHSDVGEDLWWQVNATSGNIGVETGEGCYVFRNYGSIPDVMSTWTDSDDALRMSLGNWLDGDTMFKAPGMESGDTWTFSIMLKDGTIYSLPFTIPVSYTAQHKLLAQADIDGGLLAATKRSSEFWIWVVPPPGEAMEVIYWELKEGSANAGHEWVSGIAPVKDDFRTPTLAVRTSHNITGYQIGGVRPSLPSKGLVWALVESGRITSLQIYNGQAWEAVDGRIWTGSRWVPYYSYDIVLLKDMYDIIGADPEQEYIYTEQGFWSWLQSAWKQMLSRLDAILAALSGGSSGPSGGSGDGSGVPVFPVEPDDPETEGDDSWTFIDLLVVLKDGTWKVVSGIVTTGFNGFAGFANGVMDMGNYFDAFNPASSNSIFNYYVEEGTS